jgi:diamine N-acetyltransferase
MYFESLVNTDSRIAPLIQLLEPALSIATIQARLDEMFQSQFQCVGAFIGDQLIGLAGFSIRTHCFSGRVMYVENVVLQPAARGAKSGEALMMWLELHARAAGCHLLTLDAYAKNTGARRFYERLGYDPRGVHFVKELARR